MMEMKLLVTVKRRFYWPGLAKDIKRFCHEWPVCQANNHSTQLPIGLLQPLPAPMKLFEEVTIDWITHLAPTSRGFDAIFTIVNQFSKLVHFVPRTTTIDAEGIARLFFDHWVCKFGMP